MVLEITRYEGRRRARGALVLTLLIGTFALFVVGLFPSISSSGVDLEAYVESLPPAIQAGFGVDGINTIEGFLATELYVFLWLLMLGLYVAYLAGACIASDVESGRMDLLLAAPVTRARVVVETYLSLLVPILTVNLVMPVFVYGGVVAVGESLAWRDLLAVHVLSLPYLLACASLGLLLSVLLSRVDLAQRGAIALVFVLFLVDTVTVDTDYEWLGMVSPTRYFDPSSILVESTYDVTGALILLAAATALLLVSVAVFERVDL